MERNIRLYPWYMFFRDCYFWGSAFFLYFTSVLSLFQALMQEAVYYAAIATLEVPSGYLSDRCSRKQVLALSSFFLAVSYLLFYLGNTFVCSPWTRYSWPRALIRPCTLSP